MGSILKTLPEGILPGKPITALAPMQDVTDLPFMSVINHFGAPDYFFTEYFRVHVSSTLDKELLRSITENPSDRPVFAQLIGEDLTHLERTVEDLLQYPIAGIDLNMGCPAPKVYKKCVGGGLLRDLDKIDRVLELMRKSIPGLFTVKMRIGFDGTDNFEQLLELINKHDIDLLSLHARTVKEMYRSEVHYDFIKRAVEVLKCPVLANGNITSYNKAAWVLDETGAYGVMIGRSAIRNPWIFRQIREHQSNKPIFQPTMEDVYQYIQLLKESTFGTECLERLHVNRLKKFLNFVGQGVDSEGKFLHAMRRMQSYADLEAVCDTFLLSGENAQKPFAAEPHEGVIARPNCA